ncbi:hypothetical protein KIH39_15855 [Telmatocola sphagniphila]|uniref:Uncharacterized protein n=1 Tax=Telmatocola sphagniphila TaxID=1123043 RepID=A0A8E6B1Y7_9BACT|nr:hypothetical protein [Telmatocola sphagniphila]QVL30327.1 hypothetical protein KIH39_15855 [Telmatocola sphagniphila]
MTLVRTRMGSDRLSAEHYIDPFDVDLHRHRLKGRRAGNAVAIVVVADHLILVDLARFVEAGIERTRRQQQSLLQFAREALADGLRLPLLRPLAIAFAAGS